LEHKKKQKIIKIENDEQFSPRSIKSYLIEKTNNTCQICGIKDWNGKPLVKILDHIDGRADNNCLSNFQLICSNCDSQLDTYKAKNKNSDRKYRKKYS